MKAKIAKPGGYIEVDLADILEMLEDYFAARADVVDGDYGHPEPNQEMFLLTQVQDAQEAFCK